MLFLTTCGVFYECQLMSHTHTYTLHTFQTNFSNLFFIFVFTVFLIVVVVLFITRRRCCCYSFYVGSVFAELCVHNMKTKIFIPYPIILSLTSS
jgi:hypothetical protein